MKTPLYDALKALAAQKTVRFHMPGHKGHPMPVPELTSIAPLDFTEITGTGNLYEAGEPIDSAQALWAQAAGFDHAQFLTGGSTMGIHTALTLCCPTGSGLLVDRGCHRAVFNSMALLDLQPTYLPRPWRAQDNLTGPISPEMVENLLDAHPEIKTVCITSPTYSGVLSDIPAIAHKIHARGGKLVVDAAHGAHLLFLGTERYEGADAVVVSAHKTLPALGQTAVLLTRGIPAGEVRRMASLYGSSSPSYPMLLSLDAARAWMEGEGLLCYRRAAEWTAQLRARFPALLEGDGLRLDPTRLTLMARDGDGLARALESAGVFAEMSDRGHVVLILTGSDRAEDIGALTAVLEDHRGLLGSCPPLPPPPVPERVLSLRQAVFAPVELLPLPACAGRVAAAQLAPYPPGVPVVAPGERITEKELAYFAQIGYNKDQVQVVRR